MLSVSQTQLAEATFYSLYKEYQRYKQTITQAVT